jgi:hypothetical protein
VDGLAQQQQQQQQQQQVGHVSKSNLCCNMRFGGANTMGPNTMHHALGFENIRSMRDSMSLWFGPPPMVSQPPAVGGGRPYPHNHVYCQPPSPLHFPLCCMQQHTYQASSADPARMTLARLLPPQQLLFRCITTAAGAAAAARVAEAVVW